VKVQCSPNATLRERLDLHAAPFISGQCREWLGAKNNWGYGRLMWKGRARLAHRLAHIEYIGPIPEGLDVLHSCDNPGCISHEHLFLGTNADNAADMVFKGRAYTKLTEAQVLAIRADSRTQTVIAAAYGVDRSNVSLIKNGRTWAHIKQRPEP